ncbi:zinc finger protein 711-like isoform X1 [Nasonia vitripennis]|uniref:C2H2-type domain-containing protein n=1 Tax=Nasonia vitripennis TaxID=7425 RepID=A0A7M7LSB9_NASVI|nr:zinc finger protein 711-like isoform X1 [Nasonia vitripennis]
MAELLAGKQKPEEDNNNCIASNKDRDAAATRVKPVMKFDILTDRQLRIPNLYKTGNSGVTSASYSENENNYNLSLNECDCWPEMTPVILNGSDKITTGLPSAAEERIIQAQNRIAKYKNSNSDATISAEKNIHATGVQETKAIMDPHETSSWMEDFELKLSDESHDEIENDENHDSNNVNGKDNSRKSLPRKSPIIRNFYKGAEDPDVVMKEIVDQNIKENVESTPKTKNGKKKNPKRLPKNQTTLMQYMSPASSKNTPSEVRKPQVEPKKEVAISTTAIKLPDGMKNIFNAKVVLERLPSSLLPAVPSNLKRKTSTRIPKVEIAPQSSKTTRKDPSSKFKGYCSKCKTSVDSFSIRSDLKCSKCNKILIFLCVTCDSQFESYHTLTNHRKTKCSVDKQLKCEFCDYKTPFNSNLKLHVDRRHSNKENVVEKLKCSKCKTEFKREMTLKKHLVDCKADSKTSQAAARGNKVETDSNLIERKCPKCRKTIRVTHSENCPRCTNPIEFTCLKCQDVFSKHSCIVHHLKSGCDELFQERQFHCPHCIRLPKDSKKCLFCPYKANAIFNLIEHLKLYHTMTSSADAVDGKIQRHVCTVCGKEFADRSSLRGHKKLCSVENVPMMKCQVCDFKTKFAYNIKRHMATVHSN